MKVLLLRYAATLFFSSAVILGSCSKPTPRQTSGQVFIVTRSGESIKLGLVELRLYERAAFDEAVRKWKELVRLEADPAEDLKLRASTFLVEATSARDRLKHDLLSGTVGRGLNRSELEALIAPVFDSLKNAEANSQAADAYHSMLLSAAPIFRFLEQGQPLDTTKTDADGNFTIGVPAVGEFVLAAKAGRELVGEGEVYFWAIAAPTSQKINLSNDNLTSAKSSGGSLVQTGEITVKDLKLAKGTLADLQKMVDQNSVKLPRQSTPVASASVSPSSTSVPTEPLPEFSPLPSPEFVRLTKQFTLLSPKGKEIKTLQPGKRLRLMSRDQNSVTIDYFGDSFVIPSEITEPSK